MTKDTKAQIAYLLIMVTIFGVAIIGFIFLSRLDDKRNAVHDMVIEAQEQVNCVSSIYMYTDHCLKKVTDYLAEMVAREVEQETITKREIEVLDGRRASTTQAIEIVNTLINGI